MLIQGLDIERFGRKSLLRVIGFGPGLNVVYGPAGSGKSTVVDCLRWLLYGYAPMTSEGAAPPAAVAEAAPQGPAWEARDLHARGALQWTQGTRSQRLTRAGDGTLFGRVTLNGADFFPGESTSLESLLGPIDAMEFALVYTPRIDRVDGLPTLIRRTGRRGLFWDGPSAGVDGEAPLHDEWIDARQVGNPSVRPDRRVEALRARQRELQRQLPPQPTDFPVAGAEGWEGAANVDQRVREVEAEVQRLRQRWLACQTEIERCRSEWAAQRESWYDGTASRSEVHAADAKQAAALLEQARQLHAEIRGRYDRLERQVRENRVDLDRQAQERRESISAVRRVAEQLDAIRHHATLAPELARDAREMRQRDRTAPMACLDLLREQVQQLCQTLEDQLPHDRVRAVAEEIELLRQCDRLMGHWVSGLEAQRDQLHDNRYDHPRTSGHGPRVHSDREQERQLWLRRRDATWRELLAAEAALEQWTERQRQERVSQDRGQPEVDALRREFQDVAAALHAAETDQMLCQRLTRLENALDLLRGGARPTGSPTVDHASRILCRLTQGRLTRLRLGLDGRYAVENDRGQWLPDERLADAARQWIYLALCLAMVTDNCRRGIALPFLLDEAWLADGWGREDSLAEVLREFADMGQQVVVLTRQPQLAECLRRQGARMLSLEPLPLAPPAATPVKRARRQPIRFRQPSGNPRRNPRPGDERNEPLTLSPATRIESSGTLGRATAQRLRSIGIRTVGDLLKLKPSEADHYLADWGLSLETFKKWQDELELRCHIPGLQREDARLLVVCGLRRLDALARLNTKQLSERLGRYLTSAGPRTRGLWKSAGSLGRARLGSWIHAARRFVAAEARGAGLPGSLSEPEDRPPAAPWGPAPRRARSGRQRVARRSTRRLPRANGNGASPTPASATAGRYYLSAADDIAVAPAIRNRMARRLRSVGVLTIADLLSLDAADVARRLRLHRITAEVVVRWQQQAALLYQVPDLLPVDAELLVASGIVAAGQLAAMPAENVWARVASFLATPRGLRILGTAQQPRRSHARRWVIDAQRARELQPTA